MELSGSNVVSFVLADGTVIIVRPSGTEPKVKVYVLAHGEDITSCRNQVEEYSSWAQRLSR